MIRMQSISFRKIIVFEKPLTFSFIQMHNWIYFVNIISYEQRFSEKYFRMPRMQSKQIQGLPKKTTVSQKSIILLIYSEMIRKCKISTFNISVIGRLLWETLYYITVLCSTSFISSYFCTRMYTYTHNDNISKSFQT